MFHTNRSFVADAFRIPNKILFFMPSNAYIYFVTNDFVRKMKIPKCWLSHCWSSFFDFQFSRLLCQIEDGFKTNQLHIFVERHFIDSSTKFGAKSSSWTNLYELCYSESFFYHAISKGDGHPHIFVRLFNSFEKCTFFDGIRSIV